MVHTEPSVCIKSNVIQHILDTIFKDGVMCVDNVQDERSYFLACSSAGYLDKQTISKP